jgi:hypothetical protein
MAIDPPLSLPTIVIVVDVVTVNEVFGTNLNLLPTTTCDVVLIKSLANDGTVFVVVPDAFD